MVIPTNLIMNGNKIIKSILYLSVLFTLGLHITGCGNRERPVRRIGVSQCSGDYFREKTNEELRLELLNHPDVTLDIRSADSDNDRQIADIADFIDKGYDLIMISPNESEPAIEIVRKAREKGIPVVTFDRRLASDDFTAHMEVDNHAIGAGVAQYARSLRKGSINTVEVRGPESASPARLRHEGFVEEAAKDDRIHILASVCGEWDDARSAMLIDSLLDIYPEINLVYAHTDHMGLGVARKLKERGRKDIAVIGVDGFPDIGLKGVSEGKLTATFLYPTEGERLLKTALAILDGQPYERVTAVAPLSPVDSSNADILIAQRKLIDNEEEKIRLLNVKVDDYLDRYSTQQVMLSLAGIVVILLCAGLFLLLRMFHLNRRHRDELLCKNAQLEREKKKQQQLYERLSEATKSKLMFFTNVSHDLRTPLTLIAGPVEQVAEDTSLSERNRALMKLTRKNVNILRRLIDQILDFRKYENGKSDLHLTETDFPALLKEWGEAFADVAQRRDIKLTFDMETASRNTMAVDAEKMERVFFNLMSNAFKHTPDNGRIAIRYRENEDTASYTIADTGSGINPEDIEKIFDRFYQAEGMNPKGSGIGLALTKAFIELHGGTITVKSVKGKGSEFTVTVPIRHTSERIKLQPESHISQRDIATELSTVESSTEEYENSKPTLLVIDDNKDIQALVSQSLGEEYNVITASDGLQGIKAATKYVPDLIICDVMMPVMDGMECVKRLKEEISTSHIPVLMLTACTLDSQRIEGYDNGADAYISKPFNLDVLAARCRNLLAGRKRIRELYGKGVGKKRPATTEKGGKPVKASLRPNDVESEFYSRFVELVEEKMSDPNLKVDDIAAEMGLGQSQFTRKIKALTNYTPVELIRDMRLQRARTMLMSTEKTVSEIAFEVGFTSLAYFSRCYKEAFGSTPTANRG